MQLTRLLVRCASRAPAIAATVERNIKRWDQVALQNAGFLTTTYAVFSLVSFHALAASMQDYNGVMDNIMQQLLSRELMYDPIKQVTEHTPRTEHKQRTGSADCIFFVNFLAKRLLVSPITRKGVLCGGARQRRLTPYLRLFKLFFIPTFMAGYSELRECLGSSHHA